MNMGPGEDSHFMGASKACDGAFGGISLSWQQQPWEWAREQRGGGMGRGDCAHGEEGGPKGSPLAMA